MILHPRSKDGTFTYLLLLTAFLLLLEISFFIQGNRSYFHIFFFVAHKLTIPLSILPAVLFFICAQLVLHLVYCGMLYLIVESIDAIAGFSEEKKLSFLITTWCVGTATVLTANQFYFPNSKFSALTSLVLFNQTITSMLLLVLALLWCIAIFIAIMGMIKSRRTRPFLYFFLLLGLLSVCCFFLKLLAAEEMAMQGRSEGLASHGPAIAKQPNIIVVGVDSLRPDFLGYFGGANKTPFFDSFLQQSSVFSEAVTPLARTFPSWASILTGLYPKQMNIRTNLAKQSGLSLGQTLPNLLRKQGYETIFATDETRFSNIDKDFGFDKVMTPPMGLNDFLLGSFNDFPLSNFIINTPLGKWLFPYSYANRPAYFVYDPDSFLNLLRPIFDGPQNKPLFLAVHFCLPHYPYLWAGENSQGMTIPMRYAASIVRVDAQLKAFFTSLQQAHLLDHAIVVLLSDHGEALELPGDRITEQALFISSPAGKTAPIFYPVSDDDEAMDESAGHGTDVLGLPQYHSLLAFRFYGLPRGAQQSLQNHYQARNVPGVVSLLDIKPTLLDFLHLPVRGSSGQSLLSLINDPLSVSSRRDIFLESDFTPEAIRTIFPEEQKAVLEGADLFRIDPVTTRLITKDTMVAKIILSKQYADIDGEWMLALYPQTHAKRMPILINLRTGEWTNDLTTAFARRSPAQHLLKSLHAFYGNELG